MNCNNFRLTYTEYLMEANQFIPLSNKLNDNWRLHDDGNDEYNVYIKKDIIKEVNINDRKEIIKGEYVISYNVSYGVPTFSFNYWKSTGVLFSLEEIRKLSYDNISKDDFYSVITQQEHPILFRPFFTVHPCHTGTLLTNFKGTSKNLIVTFLSQIAPLLMLDIPLEYAM